MGNRLNKLEHIQVLYTKHLCKTIYGDYLEVMLSGGKECVTSLIRKKRGGTGKKQ